MQAHVAKLSEHLQSALTLCRGVAVHQRQAQGVLGVAQREIVSGSFGVVHRLFSELQRGVVGQQPPTTIPSPYVMVITMAWVVGSV